jgi:SAM-dependent methyltransferase
MKERWKQFLKTVATPPTKAILYSYPSTNSRKDRNTEKQDPEMRKREHLLYSKWVDREWEVAIDFGCGTGATFPCFDQQQHQSNLLVGIEPDPSRACAARDYANGLKHVEAVVLCSDISLLENTPNDLFADLILCSQVLGHVPKRELGRIIKCFAARLRTGGSCAIALPVVGASFAEDPTAGGWIPGDDFIHLVYFNRSPFEKDFRKRVPDDVFDQYALYPQTDVLPVCCFWMPDFPETSRYLLPTPMSTPPVTLAQAAAPYFEISEIVLYSIHATRTRNDKTAIGDVILTLVKR